MGFTGEAHPGGVVDSLRVFWEIYQATRAGKGSLIQKQQQRLESLVAFARERSPFYRRLYQGLPLDRPRLSQLPITTKPLLMGSFDEWATDRAITRVGIHAFLADKTQIGGSYLGRYAVWSTSGTTGTPGIFVHDAFARRVYTMLILARAYPAWFNPGQWPAMLRAGFRYALVIATGDHYASVSNWEYLRQQAGRFASRLLTLSVLDPLPELTERLNRFQPTVVASYPSALSLLAAEQTAGRLNIRPLAMTSVGEWLDPAMRAQIESAFPGSPLFDLYGASEFPYIAFECRHRWLHANLDWVVLEPVDNNQQPVPPGEASNSVLLTNLANRVQPIIRYDLGDSITTKPEACPCGSPLPAFRVAGRTDEILAFQAEGGQTAPIMPMAIAAVAEQVPGVLSYQLIQTGSSQLSVRLEVEEGSAREAVWSAVACDLRAFLTRQGLPSVELQLDPQPPQRNPLTGKMRHVFAETPHSQDDRS
ncbi:MAG: phenylacetate--CoA ligase family protein [Anaerolineaceae bacterium]|nr:phenylacetate--CoA ligase family protein [Anaerolineaceae bacterium]